MFFSRCKYNPKLNHSIIYVRSTPIVALCHDVLIEIGSSRFSLGPSSFLKLDHLSNTYISLPF